MIEIITGQFIITFFLAAITVTSVARSEEITSNMNNDRLARIIKRLDAKASGQPGQWKFMINGVVLLVFTDERADRMRIISPITPSRDLDGKRLYRLLQANFDTALDVRYSIAKDQLWAAFIHPLSSLRDREFISGVGQVVNLNQTYGGSYSSGALLFRGGDSESPKKRKLIDRLMEKGLTL